MSKKTKEGDGKTKTVLAENLFLYSLRQEDPLTMIYEVECTTIRNVNFTLDFEGSENFRVVRRDSSGRNIDLPLSEMKLTSKITPFSRVEIGRAVMVNDEQRASLRTGCSWVMEKPNDAEMAKYLSKQNERVKRFVDDALQLQFPAHVVDPTHHQAMQLCQARHKSFVDADFLPVELSIKGHPRTVADGDESGETEAPAVEWKLPNEIFKSGGTLFTGGIAPEDIQQGALGNCWFLCAIAALTEFPVLIEALFPEETREAHKYNIYTVKFCKNGLWTTVRVDGFFPCYPGGGPIFSRANGEELWVLLLEKAYAKIHGSYFAIRAGWAYEAMMDLTGAPCFSIRLDEPEVQAKVESGELWASLVRYDLENFLMSASTPGEDTVSEGTRAKHPTTGLVAGHAYTLIAAKSTSQGHQLVKLRNPWGNMEWTGDWSDTSPLWTEEIQAEIGDKVVQSDDGTFWMSFQDLLKHFHSLNICMTRCPGLNKKPWKEARRSFFFDYVPIEEDTNNTGNGNAGGKGDSFRIMSPTYLLTLSQKGTVIATVHQQDTRCEGAPAYIDVGVSILRVDPVYGTFALVTGTGNAIARQNQTEELELDAGKYLIVPTTSGCMLKQQMETIDSNPNVNAASPVELVKTLPNGDINFSDAVIKAYTELFHRMDSDNDGKLSKAEMDAYMMRTEGSTIEDAGFTWLVHNFESRETNGLSLAGFLKAQLYVFKQCGSDEEKLRKEFASLGYNSDTLELRTCRKMALSLHSTADFSLDTMPYDESARKEAEELVIVQKGERKDLDHGTIKLYKLKTSRGVSLMVENLNSKTLVFQIDCSSSKNAVSHRGDLVYKAVVGTNEKKVLHHLMPKDPEISSWTWGYSASYFWDND
eukprot:gene34919-42286_t